MSGDDYYKEGANTVFLHFPSRIVEINQEFPTYDLNSIVSAIGGGLGMLLGFSFLDCSSRLVDRCFERRSSLLDKKSVLTVSPAKPENTS